MNLDPTLLTIFEAEQQEHVARLRALLHPAGDGAALSSPPEIDEALRRAHTLKGAARAVGVAPTELLAHGVETVFARIRDGSIEGGEQVRALVSRVLDLTEDVLASVVENRPEPDSSGLLAEIDRILRGAAPPQPPPAPAEPPPLPQPQPAAQTHDQRADFVRVHTRSIDELVRSSSQLLAAAGREAAAARDAAGLADRIAAVEREWARLRQRAAASLRPLANDHRMAPLVDCVNYIDRELNSLVREARSASRSQRHTAWSLQHLATEQHRGACRVRMTPAETVFGGFGKMVRDLARESGKEVEFRTAGLDVLADRHVLQALKDPVMHLLRNAIAHGIEPAEKRTAAGKPRAGLVQLRLEPRGDRLKLMVEDDGRGIDTAGISREAVRRGMLGEAAAASLSSHDLVRLILQPGFSTAPSLTKLAGRGMGMSVVYEEVTRLQGDLSIGPGDGAGTCILLTVPLSISTQPVLLAACSGQVFGIPCSAVKRLQRIGLDEIASVDGTEVIRTDLGPVPLARLADLLGLPSQDGGDSRSGVTEAAGRFPVVIVQSAGESLGIVVDALLDQRDSLVKDLGLDPASYGMANGGVVLEDGGVAVVLNAAALLESFRRAGKAPALRPADAGTQRKIPSILVVDDSITTRSLEKSMLEAHGYKVRVAVDGLDALEQLRAEKPDLVISDVMMPRMDGLQLLDRIKKDGDLAEIPVILVTSLDKREDQERGLSLGADAYIVKQKFNQRELLNTIRQII